MDLQEPPSPTDPASLKLQRAIYYQVVHDLHAMLPHPPDEPPADYQRRHDVAIAQVAALNPTNADEANIAAHYVAASARVTEYERLAEQNAAYPDAMLRMERQAVSLMRESRGYRSLLLRVQAVRHKREDDETARNQDAWTEHFARSLMMQAQQDIALASCQPPPPPEPVSATAPVPSAAATPNALDDLDLKLVLPDPNGDADTDAVSVPDTREVPRHLPHRGHHHHPPKILRRGALFRAARQRQAAADSAAAATG